MNLEDSLDPLRTIIAPRHIKRVKKVTQILEAEGLPVRRYSELQSHPTSSWKILVIDTMGQLMSLYSAADVAFVGGSLLAYGGHNPLEPASYGIPVLFGPHMDHCRRSAQLLLKAGGGIEVSDGPQLGETISRLLQSDAERDERGQAALQVVIKDRGNAERTAEALRGKIL
jgi:3-deoxy-D-manno-octulosonic-acid transferase